MDITGPAKREWLRYTKAKLQEIHGLRLFRLQQRALDESRLAASLRFPLKYINTVIQPDHPEKPS